MKLNCEAVDTAVQIIERAHKMVTQHKSLFGPTCIGMEGPDKTGTYVIEFFPKMSEADVNFIIRNDECDGFYIEKLDSSQWRFSAEVCGNENLKNDVWKRIRNLHSDWRFIGDLLFV